MESPVIVENCAQFAQPLDKDETGFPFDDSDYDSHGHLQSRLNDIAARHPEFATHFRGLDDFPSLRRKRNTSGSSAEHEDRPGPSAGSSSHRFADHSFPSGFNRFPFSRHFEEEFAQEPHREDKPPEVPKQEKRGRKPNPYLPQHLSNTVDLGQKQPPVPETRSQRSMSAPPENRSRVEQEPANHEEQPPVMGKTFSRQNQPQQPSQPKERIIPIHVEGRDDPVMPKNPNLSSGGSTEKVFGGERPQTGFSSQTRQPDPQAQYRRQMYDQFTPGKQQQQHHPQQQQQQPFVSRQQTPPAHQEAPPPRQQATPPRQQATPPPTSYSNDPLDKIKSVRSDVMELMTNVENFAGTRKDREYLYLDEMLTRNLLKLDNVETEGKENIRLARKEAIKCIQTCINNLEARAQAREKELKNSEESTKQPETTEPQTVEQQHPVPEKQQTDQQTTKPSDPPKFTSQATLIISPPKTAEPQQKIEEQPQPPVEKMEVDPPVETKEAVVDATPAGEKITEGEKTADGEKISEGQIEAGKQLEKSDSSQTANKDTTQK